VFVTIPDCADPDFAPGTRIGGKFIPLSEPTVAVAESWERRLPAQFLVVLSDLL